MTCTLGKLNQYIGTVYVILNLVTYRFSVLPNPLQTIKCILFNCVVILYSFSGQYVIGFCSLLQKTSDWRQNCIYSIQNR